MASTHKDTEPGTILLIGASRGIGLAMAGELARRGWTVTATVRRPGRTKLDNLAVAHAGRIEIETLDINEPDQLIALRDRLSGRAFDILFVNAGTANTKDETAADISREEFARVLLTNALGPMRTIEGLRGLVAREGLIGAMSSGQGSIADNANGRHEIYRCSKAALNQLMQSYAARHAADGHALLLMAPGWIRTQLGGPDGRYSLEESIPKLTDLLLSRRGKPGLAYLDREGQPVRW